MASSTNVADSTQTLHAQIQMLERDCSWLARQLKLAVEYGNRAAEVFGTISLITGLPVSDIKVDSDYLASSDEPVYTAQVAQWRFTLELERNLLTVDDTRHPAVFVQLAIDELGLLPASGLALAKLLETDKDMVTQANVMPAEQIIRLLNGQRPVIDRITIEFAG